MNLSEFRHEMEAYWQSICAEAKSLKDYDLVRERLHDLYMKFDANERRMADDVISEWALAEDEAMRFDALVLIGDFKIVVAISALRELAIWLAISATPNAIYELKTVNRIIADLV